MSKAQKIINSLDRVIVGLFAIPFTPIAYILKCIGFNIGMCVDEFKKGYRNGRG